MTTRFSLLLILLAACGAPASSGPDPDPTPPLPSDPLADDAVEVPTDPTAETPPAVAEPEIEELERATNPEGGAVEDRDSARLVKVGLRGYANRIVSRARAQRRREMRMMRGRSRRSGGSMGSIGLGGLGSGAIGNAMGAGVAAESAAPATQAPARAAAEPTQDAADGGEESVTNTQVAGVDEGGIVKAWRDYLVILRRGRLFTARLGDQPGGAAPVSAISVRPRGSQHDGWYDEMLVHAPTGTVIVIGFSYEHSATEIGRFRIADDGSLSHVRTDLLRSNDYYSSRNYASRLIGDTLIFYMPHHLVYEDEGPIRVSMPSLRAFRGGSWRSIIDSSETYRIAGERGAATLHTVVQCDLGRPRLRCRARGIVGGEGRTFYVSRDAVYVWVEPVYDEYRNWDAVDEDEEEEGNPPHLFRLPLDGSRPSALEVRGSPVDQFSFHDTGEDLWVVVRSSGGGDGMWAPEMSAGTVGLLHVPLTAFGANVRALAPAAYRTLPSPTTEGGAMQNRFVGDYVLYGLGTTWGRRSEAAADDRVFVHHYGDGRSFAVSLPNGVDRLEPMAGDAVVVGTDGRNLHFRAIELGASPRSAGHYVRMGAAQGETRSHGFFYKPTAEGQGVLGLPTRSAQQPGAAQLVHGSAEVLYLSVTQLDFSELGALGSSGAQQNDRCEVSCVDWYGNARPLFYRGRVFALLGYELVEGRIDAGAIAEVARTSFLGALPPAPPDDDD